MLGCIVHSVQHYILEGDAPVENARGVDYLCERILCVDRHQSAPQTITRRVNRNRKPELLASLSQRDDSRKNTDCGDCDVARANTESPGVVENREGWIDRLPVH